MTREPPGVAGFHSVRTYDQPALPVRLWIPAIAVSTPLVRLGRLPDGSLQVPRDWDKAGWYDQGPRPGQPGPAVILGHVDSKSGPAVFYQLQTLRPGDIVRVGLADGRKLVFRVQQVKRYPKDKFPTEAVYLPTLSRELRLITCGGTFDYASGHYRDNIVVYATLAA
ncbi:MAG TPA: class F sortase [Streptosporangiaceae bacterium]